jgi:hypothetical protein
MFFISEDLSAAHIPFFIDWDEDSMQPSKTSPEGCDLSDFIIHTPDVERMSRLLETLNLDIEAQFSQKDSLEILMNCADNEVRL